MPAFNGTFLYFWNISVYPHFQLFFNLFLHSGIQHRRHLVQDHSLYPAVFSVLTETLNISQKGKAHALAVHYEDRRGFGSPGQIISTGQESGASHSVIISHNPFHHRNVTVPAISFQEIFQCIFFCKKGIQIPGFCPDDPGMEHRVDIVRPALKGGGL